MAGNKKKIENVCGSFLLAAGVVLLLLALLSARANSAVEVIADDDSWVDISIDGDKDDYGLDIVDGLVAFSYRDEDYQRVGLRGDFTDWETLEMELEAESGVWTLEVTIEPGVHRYQFLIEDATDQWTAIDPSNTEAATYRDFGWVSVFRIPDRDEARIARRKARRLHTHTPSVLRRELNLGYSEDGGGVTYNRVDGMSIFFEPDAHAGDRMGPLFKGYVGYGFASKDWTFKGTMLQPLTTNHRLALKFNLHSGTDFTDNTGVSDVENSLAAVFFREDFRDYYHREGISGSLVANPHRNLRLEVGYSADEYTSLINHADWSFAGGDFLVNPAVHEGDMERIFASARLGGRYSFLRAEYESAEDGDFDYTRLVTTARGRLMMGRSQHFDAQVKFGSALSGTLPNQRRFAMGGLGTVRGFAYQSLLERDPTLVNDPITLGYRGGQRMLQLNLEYGVSLGWDGWDGWETVHEWDDAEFRLEGIDGFDGMLFFFMDSGLAWEDREAEVSLDDMESSIGIGYRFGQDGLRLDVARPISSRGGDPIFQARITRMF